MTALLRKDLYLVGKQTWMVLAVALVFCLTPQFEQFGSAYLMVLTMTLPLTTLAYDERCHWDQYVSMMPCRPKKIVLSKYLFTLTLAAAALSVTLLITWLRAHFSGETYDLVEQLVGRLTLLVLILTVNSITMPSVYRFGVEKGRIIMMLLCFGSFAGIIAGAKIFGADIFAWMETLPLPVLGAAAAGAVIVFNIVSFFLSVRFYKNRRAGVYG